MSVFGQSVKRYRTVAGLTQTQIAARVGRSASMLAAIERGDRKVHADEIVSFARALNVSPVALLGPAFGGGYDEGWHDGFQAARDRLTAALEEARRG